VIDPRTGYPAGDLLSLTVLMPSASDADACATGLFVAGREAINQWAQEDWMPPNIMVGQASRQDSVQIEWTGDIHWVEAPASEDSPLVSDD
jgi:thiamine biosynthesis lipoprotein